MENKTNVEAVNKNKSMSSIIQNISADAAIKAVFSADDKELIKFINATLYTSHDPDTAAVEFLKPEFISQTLIAQDDSEINITYDKIIADMVFRINDNVYNIEFQTRHDKTMLCRIAEYQFGILSDRISREQFLDEYEGTVTLPRMIIVQLEKSSNVPDYYKLWFLNETTGEKLLQKFPIIKLWEHSIEDLSNNGKHLLLPFKSIGFRKAVKKGNVMNEKTTQEFVECNKNIRKTIFTLAGQEKLSTKAVEQMLIAHNHLMKYFLDRYIKKDNPARKEVEDMLVVTERPPTMSELIIAEAQKQVTEAQKREAEAQKREAEAQKREAEAQKQEAKARQEIANRDAEIAKLNAALIELMSKAEDTQ